MAAPRIAVLLGTDHHPFDRLVEWVVDLGRTSDATWFVQHGYTRLPAGVDGSAMLDPDSLSALLAQSDAVVTHGGPGLIMEAREAGHRPIVVPRDPSLHEHVDDHQQRFAEHVGAAGLAVVVHDALELRRALLLALNGGRAPRGLPRTGPDPSVAFGNLVARVLSQSMTPSGRRSAS